MIDEIFHCVCVCSCGCCCSKDTLCEKCEINTLLANGIGLSHQPEVTGLSKINRYGGDSELQKKIRELLKTTP